MLAYVLLLALACGVSAACAGGQFASSPRSRPTRLVALLFLGASYWALCHIGAAVAPDAGTALRCIRASALGWIFIGPLTWHVLLESTGDVGRARGPLAVLYGVAAVLLPCTLATSWVFAGVTPSCFGWGWSLVPGPLLPGVYVAVVSGLACAVMVAARALRTRLSLAELRQFPWIGVGAAVPLVVGSGNDVVLPMAGVAPPPLGSIAFAVLAALALWKTRHFGYSLFTSGSFASEILGALPDGVAFIESDGRIRSVNEGFAALAGRPADALAGMHLGQLVTMSFGDAQGRQDEVDCELRNASGTRTPVSLFSTSLQDRRGNPFGSVLVLRDLAEIQELRDRLVNSGRLAAVGELAAGIAHEINNPIAFVRSNLGQLKSHWKTLRISVEQGPHAERLAEPLGEGDELIDESIEGVDRAAEIVRSVRGLTPPGVGEREPADLNELIDDVLHMLSWQIRDGVRLERNYGRLPPIPGSPQQLKQVFANLIVNAEQAVGKRGGVIAVDTAVSEGWVVASIRDDGPGIPAEILPRIFDPFFTTKAVGEGTGLGLGIAAEIVRGHGGELQVDSREHAGTCVRVKLPS